MDTNKLNEILRSHNAWLRGEEGGQRAYLYRASLRGVNLVNVNLSGADLYSADLADANLSGANLVGADLGSANLIDANLSYTNLRSADLNHADLREANLTRADLSDANLTGTDLTRANLSGARLCGANMIRAELCGVVGGNDRIQSLQIAPYKIVILDKKIVWGGCTKKTAQEWLDYPGDERSESDKKYLETITKPFIRTCIA